MNRIGWCSATFNPVWGCLNHCEYCYARKIAKRFAEKMADIEIGFKDIEWKNLRALNKKQQKKYCSIIYPLMDFQPTWLESNFQKLFPKKSQRIFVGSMSEIYYWDEVWIQKVIDKIKEYPQHTFQFLTKFPEIYYKWVFPKNCWLGMTITKEEDINKNWTYIADKDTNCFFSIEPFLDSINPESLESIDWVIIGAESGNRKDKVIPQKKWIEKIVNYCKCYKIPIYLKDSLKGIYPIEIKEFPKIEL